MRVVRRFLGWFFLVIGVFGFFQQPISGLVFISWGVLLLPFTNQFAANRGWDLNLWKRLGIAFIGFVLLGLTTPRSQTQQIAVSPSKSSIEGEQIFKKLRGTYDLSGLMTPTPTVRVIIPQEGWNKLSASEQVQLAAYAESLISIVKAEPAKHIDTPSTAPVYKSFVEKASDLCEDCWSIVVSQKNNQPYSIDKTVVQGETPWNQDDPCCRGKKASELGKS
jgi:hypothetical protein